MAARVFVALFGFVIIAGIAIYGGQAALSDAGDDVTVTNETWTPDAGNWTDLDKSNIEFASYDETVTVRDENETLMDRGTDYDWNSTDGTVFTIIGGGLDGDANATITYDYQVSTGQQRTFAATLGVLPQVVGAILPLFAVVVLLRIAGG